MTQSALPIYVTGLKAMKVKPSNHADGYDFEINRFKVKTLLLQGDVVLRLGDYEIGIDGK